MTNYHAEDLTQHVWRMARNVIIPRPDPFSHLSSPQCVLRLASLTRALTRALTRTLTRTLPLHLTTVTVLSLTAAAQHRCPEAGVPPVSVKRPFLVAYVGSQISEFRRRLVSVLQVRRPHPPHSTFSLALS
jgi:hypothetical protein